MSSNQPPPKATQKIVPTSKPRDFFRSNLLAIFCISALLLIPVFWHRHIAGGDLASHVYNAWLAELVSQGKAPGLHTVWQWDNVLFDLTLYGCAKIVGLHAAERIVVSLSVLIFFWGVFWLLRVFAEEPPWLLATCVAMLAYGYTFQMGFFNYYLSLGLASAVVAAFLRGGRGNWTVGFVLLPLILLAHPIGFLWCVALLLYVVLWSKLKGYMRLVLPVLALLLYAGIHFYVVRQEGYDFSFRQDWFVWMNGSDQLNLYGQRYAILANVALAWGIGCFVCGIWKRFQKREPIWKELQLSLSLYVVSIAAAAFLPENLRTSENVAWMGLLVSRLSAITAIFGLAVLATTGIRKWQAAGFAVCAASFFVFLYQDTGHISRMESSAEAVIQSLPHGARIVPVITAPDGWRVPFIAHGVERACVGHCFSYSNYEPSSKQFRVRVKAEGSPLVTSNPEESEDMASGDYRVRESELPLYSIMTCDDSPDFARLCAYPLKAGDKTEDPTED